MKDETGLTPKERAFCENYIQLGNATKAARQAGYSDKYVGQTGAKLLKNPKIAAYIAERMDRKNAGRIADANEVIEFYTRVMRGEERDQFGLEASLSDRLKAGENLMKRLAVATAGEGVTVIIDV